MAGDPITTTTTTIEDRGVPRLRKWMDGNFGQENTKTIAATTATVITTLGEEVVVVETVVTLTPRKDRRRDHHLPPHSAPL